MANYTASALLAAQTKFTQKFNEPELRRKQNPALLLALQNQQVTIQNLQEIRKKDTRPVKAYIKTKATASNGTSKSHSHNGGKSDSAEVTLAWVQFQEPFSIQKKQGQSNVFAYQEQLEHELMERARIIHDRAGTAALAFVQTYRNQLASVTTGGAGDWNATNYALEITSNEANWFLQNAASFMRANNHRPQFDAILDSRKYREVQRIINQGQANATNLAWQSEDFSVIAETTETIDANYTAGGCALVMPAGSFAGLPWNDPKNLRPDADNDMGSSIGGYSVISDPLGTGVLFDIHGYAERNDGSSLGGGKQDILQHFELTLTIGWALPPLSTAGDSVVFELAQV